MKLTRLNLPVAPLQLKRMNGTVYVRCLIRNKDLVCTPEEWVRQHVINHLIEGHNVKKGRIAVEFSLKYNGLAKRADIVVMNAFGEPELLVECKAPDVNVSRSVLEQAASYNFKLNVDKLLLTNGITHVYCLIDREKNELQFPEELKFVS